jgi:hypothetical protein
MTRELVKPPGVAGALLGALALVTAGCTAVSKATGPSHWASSKVGGPSHWASSKVGGPSHWSPSKVGGREPVWVALEGGGRLIRVNVAKRRVVRGVSVPGAPHNITVARDGTVIATLPWAGRIVLVRRERVKVVRLGGYPHDVKVARGVAVVTNEASARLNRVSLKGRKKPAITLRANPHDVAISPDGRVAWVSLDGTDDVAIVNLVKRKVRRYVSTGRRPHDLLFGRYGRRVWVTDWDGSIHVFSRRGQLVRTMNIGVEAHHLAFTPSGRQVWVTDHGARRVWIIRTKPIKVLAFRRIKGAPHHVAITSDGRRAIVADHERGVLVIFNVRTRRRGRHIDVGTGPHGVWAVP